MMTYEPIWSASIAWYLFLAGLGAGAFIASAFIRWKHPQATTMRRIGYCIAPIVVFVGLILLIIDAEGGLYNPLRFTFLLNNFGSVMTWGVVFLGGFMIVSLIVLVLDVKKKRIPLWLELVGVIFAISVGAYTGALLGVCKTFPLWNNALLPILFLVSAVSTGIASVLLVSVFLAPKELDQVGALKRFHFWFPVIEMVLIASLLFITSTNSVAGWESVMSMISGSFAVAFWLGLVVIGLVMPTLIEAWLLFFASKDFEESRNAHILSAVADGGVLVGGFLLRLIIVLAAVPLTIVAS